MAGVMFLLLSLGATAQPIETVSNRQPSNPDFMRGRNILFPTALSLPGGTIYLSDTWVLFPSLTVAVTHYLMVSGGISLIPTVSVSDQLMYLTPRITAPVTEKASVGVALMMLRYEEWHLGLLTLMGTYGRQERSHFTAGIGLGYYGEEGRSLEWANRPALVGGYYLRGSPRIALVGEAWTVPRSGWSVDELVLGFVLRFFKEELGIEMGAYLFSLARDPILIPYLSASIRLSSEK